MPIIRVARQAGSSIGRGPLKGSVADHLPIETAITRVVDILLYISLHSIFVHKELIGESLTYLVQKPVQEGTGLIAAR